MARQAVDENVREAAELRATVFALQHSHRLAAQRLGKSIGIGPANAWARGKTRASSLARCFLSQPLARSH